VTDGVPFEKHMRSEAKKSIRRHRRRRLLEGLNFSTGLALIVVLVAMANYLASRHYCRAHWGRVRHLALSDKTMALLCSLKAPCRVLVFFQPAHEAFGELRGLLKEYQHACDKLTVEYVDPDRDLARVKELALKHGLTEANVVVVESAGRRKQVTAHELVEELATEPAPAVGRAAYTRRVFRGEQLVSSAILSVSQARTPVVCFTRGHGEKDIESFDQYAGYSRIRRYLRLDGVTARSVALGRPGVTAQHCDVLVIAGPRKPFAADEVELVRRHLETGNLLVLLDPGVTSGLESLLEEWGVRIGGDKVVEPAGGPVLGAASRGVSVSEYGMHPITRHLARLITKFYVPCALDPVVVSDGNGSAADRPRVTVLASSSPEGWAETDFSQEPPRYDEEHDRPGPIPIVVAVEKGPVPGLDVQIRPTRMIVIGDSDAVANHAVPSANVDFFMAALNWLLEREELMAIAPKVRESYRLEMNKTALYGLFGIVVVAFPAVAGLFGLLVWVRHR